METMPDRFTPQPNHHYHFVTGRLAEPAVREIVDALAQRYSFSYSVGVMPITVAALMTPRWLRRKLDVPREATHVILPGYCEAGIEELSQSLEIPVICGPNDCRMLPEFFGDEVVDDDFGDYDIQIIAEINHAPRLAIDEVVARAICLRADGADIIDFGCDPVAPCTHIGDYITALIDHGLTVSVDTFDPAEAAAATRVGASLVLSVNSSNREPAVDWGCEVVVIPDSPHDEKSLHDTVDFLARNNVPMRLDPILEPIGAGLAKSLLRYATVRNNFPDAEVMMGIGNLTELSDVDSAGVNLMLIGICQELGIRSVLTTQVINWARSSVRECDIARRLAHYAVAHGVPPKRLSEQLVMLRDAKLRPFPPTALQSLMQSLKDNNYRLFAQQNEIHLVAAGLQISDADPFKLFDNLMSHPQSDNVDPGHAFYLGYEMAKASIALTLGKQYEQDQALQWGLLTKAEDLHRIARTSRHRK
jgi:dihydropteroate synthase-like protein